MNKNYLFGSSCYEMCVWKKLSCEPVDLRKEMPGVKLNIENAESIHLPGIDRC